MRNKFQSMFVATTLVFLVDATTAVADVQYCVEDRGNGFAWENNKWTATGFNPIRYPIQIDPDHRFVRYNNLTLMCEKNILHKEVIYCDDNGGYTFVLDTLNGEYIFSKTYLSKGAQQRDTLSISVGKCSKF